MSISLKGKSIIKKVALILAGVTALTATGFGVKAIVDYTKDDLKTITPLFSVGNLGSDGKYVDDKSTLYTKEAFGCYGLQVKPDFDSKVNYQIYYYDFLDNYISSTEVLSDGYSKEAPVNGAYARMVIEPKEDEDGKISLTERVSYPKNLTVKVKKEQDIEERFGVLNGKNYQVVSTLDKLVFENGLALSSKLEWLVASHSCVTSTTVLKVSGGTTLNFDKSKLGEKYSASRFVVHCFKDMPSNESFVEEKIFDGVDSMLIDTQIKYIIITVVVQEVSFTWEDSAVAKLPSCFTITKAN